MSPALLVYLELERLMLLLEAQGDSLADRVRDTMDPFWYRLSADDRRLLDLRLIGAVHSLEGIRIPVREAIRAPTKPHEAARIPRNSIGGWRSVA